MRGLSAPRGPRALLYPWSNPQAVMRTRRARIDHPQTTADKYRGDGPNRVLVFHVCVSVACLPLAEPRLGILLLPVSGRRFVCCFSLLILAVLCFLFPRLSFAFPCRSLFFIVFASPLPFSVFPLLVLCLSSAFPLHFCCSSIVLLLLLLCFCRSLLFLCFSFAVL